MCSFGSRQTRFEFLSQFRKVRHAFECFVTQLPKTKRSWPMKINVICIVYELVRTKCCTQITDPCIFPTDWSLARTSRVHI